MPKWQKNFKSVRKWVQSLCALLRQFISEMKEKCYYSLLPYVLQMCTRIKIFRYLVTGCHEKLSSSYRWYQKHTVGPTFVRTKSQLSCASIEYQISNREFSNFLRTYYCDFLSYVYSWRCVFSCDNGQCDAHSAGIAVTRSSHCFCF